MLPALIPLVTPGISELLKLAIALAIAGLLITRLTDGLVMRSRTALLLSRPRHAKEQQRLRSFAAATAGAGALTRRGPRPQTVELSRIVGSVGRFHELAADFRPARRARRRLDDERFERVRRAMQRGEHLPSIELYQIGYTYYILDGHHRVAAALRLGQLAIDANVVEFVPEAGLTGEAYRSSLDLCGAQSRP